MGTEVAAPAPDTKFTRADIESWLGKAGEAGARTYMEAHKPEAPKTETATQEQEATQEQIGVGGITRSLDDIGGLGIPFGSVLVGAIPGVVVGELIDGFIPPSRGMLNPAAKVGAAWVGVQYGRRLLGTNGAMFFAGALALQALTALLPIDQWTAQLTSALRRNSVVAQAEQVARAAQMGQQGGRRGASQVGGLWA